VAELIAEHLKKVGLKVLVKQIDPQLWTQRANANELQATMIWTDDQGWDDRWTRLALCQGGGSRLWCLWDETAGQQGEEPPEWVKKGLELNAKRWTTIPGSEEYNQIVEQELAWHRENLPIITMVENVKYAMIASRRLGNIPSSGYAIAANFSGEQFFFKE
jgi:peptide/nickel transport system substrate-binding protein